MSARNSLPVALAVLSLLCVGFAQSNGVPFGFIHRTFFLKAGTSLGTAFAIEYKGRQYPITARHVVQPLPRESARIQVFRTENWKDLTVDILTPENDDVDIAVLVPDPPNERIATQEDASFGELTGGGINLGGQIYFLGFPMDCTAFWVRSTFL